MLPCVTPFLGASLVLMHFIHCFAWNRTNVLNARILAGKCLISASYKAFWGRGRGVWRKSVSVLFLCVLHPFLSLLNVVTYCFLHLCAKNKHRTGNVVTGQY